MSDDTSPTLPLSATGTTLFRAGGPVFRDPVVMASEGKGLGIWRIDATGHPVGAWVLKPGERERCALLVQGRPLVALAEEESTDLLRIWLESEQQFPKPQLLVATALEDVIDARDRLHERVRERRGKPLEWSREVRPAFADALQSGDLKRLSEGARIAPGDQRALLHARVIREVLRLWQDTESSRVRRSYLRTEFGEPEALPPSWRAALAQVAVG